MTDLEFDVLDELYFVIPYKDLLSETELEENELCDCLKSLIEKGWVKCFQDMDTEISKPELDFKNKFREYAYLATKKGLLAHNGH